MRSMAADAIGFVLCALVSSAAAAPEGWGGYWPEWAQREVEPSACKGDVAAALEWVSGWSGVPCIVPFVRDERGERPEWLSRPADLRLPCDTLRGIVGWVRPHGYYGVTTRHFVVVVPEGPSPWGLTSTRGRDGMGASVLSMALATAPLEVAARLACGSRVLAQQLTEEVQTALERAAVLSPRGRGLQQSLDGPLGMSVGLTPTVEFLLPDGTGRTLELGEALRERNPLVGRALGVPKLLSLDVATGRADVVEWGPDRLRADFPGEPPEGIADSVRVYQADWVLTRERLRGLQEELIDLGGTMGVGDICHRFAACRINPGPFAEDRVWASPGKAPAGSALEGLAFAIGAWIKPEGEGLALAKPEGYAAPEPLKLAARWASVRLPHREDLRLVCLALDGQPAKPFGELDAEARDLIRACLASREHPPAVVDATPARLGLNLEFGLEPLRLTRDDSRPVAEGEPVLLEVSHRRDASLSLVGRDCPHLAVDPYVLDLGE